MVWNGPALAKSFGEVGLWSRLVRSEIASQLVLRDGRRDVDGQLVGCGDLSPRRTHAHWSTSGCNEWARLQFTDMQIPTYACR
jgi:hypothetical protein